MRGCRVFERLVAGLAALLLPLIAQAATIRVACDFAGCKQAAAQWAAQTGHTVQMVSVNVDTNERLELHRRLLDRGSDQIDVFPVDLIWPRLLARHLLDLKPYTRGAERQHAPLLIEHNTVDGRLVAMPAFVDAGMLFYRKDLLQKYRLPLPRSWDQLAAAAKFVQDAERAAGHNKLWGFLWQGRAYEGLTCNAIEWIAGRGGGSVVDQRGAVTIANPRTIEALERAASWVGTISPRAVLDFGEFESADVFVAGQAMFLRSWPYAWALSQRPGSAVRGKVGVMLPPGPHGSGAAVLGGWQLGVSRYSRHPALAADLVLYLTGAEVQKQRAISESLTPTIESLYQDPQVVAALPFLDVMRQAIAGAVRRPSAVTATRYPLVSTQIWSATHEVLSGRRRAAEAVAELDRSLKQLQTDGGWK